MHVDVPGLVGQELGRVSTPLPGLGKRLSVAGNRKVHHMFIQVKSMQQTAAASEHEASTSALLHTAVAPAGALQVARAIALKALVGRT